MSETLFVYGTLKKDGHNYCVMERAKGTFVCKGLTSPYYDLVSLGGFPGMIMGAYRVSGELYEVEDLSPIDFLEGYPDFYDRRRIMITGLTRPKTIKHTAWAYFVNDNSADRNKSQQGINAFSGIKRWSNSYAL